MAAALMERVLMGFGLIASGLAGGVMVAVDLAVVPMERELPARHAVRVHQVMDRFVDPFMPIHTVLTGSIGLLLVRARSDLPGRLLMGSAIALAGTVAAVSVTRNVPINRQVRTWDPDDPPAEWGTLRARWARAHRLRTAAGMLSFLSFVLAAIIAPGGSHPK